jgi:mRNA interferase MazF
MAHIPDAGDIFWATFVGHEGSEQGGRRPGLIITSASYHALSRRAFILPITSRVRDWPTEVPLPGTLRTRGAVLADQGRFIDRQHRLFDYIETAPEPVLMQVRSVLAAILGIAATG